jgi:predicted DCC family thiol-disulfide oxidoreductase YuxK
MKNNSNAFPMTIYYESSCPLCNAEMKNLMLRNDKGLLKFADVCAPGFIGPRTVSREELLELIHATKSDGSIIKGVEVFRLAYRAVGLGWVVAPTGWSIFRTVADRLYAVVARNRHRIPRFLVEFLFGWAMRRAAQKSAAARCSSDTCHATTKELL